MSQFTSVDAAQHIWQVIDLLPAAAVADIMSLDWLSMPWTRGYLQESWPRRQIQLDPETTQRFEQYFLEQLPVINQALSINCQHFDLKWWLDEPGFLVHNHTDGELPASLQVNWIGGDPDWGTAFYKDKARQNLLWQTSGQTNTGYIMLNHKNPDGSQPELWHAMLNPVPPGQFRLSSYSVFHT
jgi:hypothetical protein